jgi:hypothetical protein
VRLTPFLSLIPLHLASPPIKPIKHGANSGRTQTPDSLLRGLHSPELRRSDRPRGTSVPIAQTLSTARPADLFLDHRSDDQTRRQLHIR